MVHSTLTGVSAVYGPDGRRLGPWLGTDASTAHMYETYRSRTASRRTSATATGRCNLARCWYWRRCA